MSTITFDEIRPLFGLRIDEHDVIAFLDRFPKHTIRKPYEGDQYVFFKSLGFDLLFRSPGFTEGSRRRPPRVLVSAFLYRKGEEEHNAFASPPFGLTFADSHERIVEKLGLPSHSNMPEGVNDSILGWLMWDRWERDGFQIHCAYEKPTGALKTITITQPLVDA